MAEQPAFLKKEAFSFGWQTTMANLGFFALLAFIVLAMSGVSQYFSSPERHTGILLPFVSIAIWVFQLIAQVGLISITLAFVDGKTAVIGDLFSKYRLFFRYLVASVLYGLIVLCGLILLVVLGIIWGIKYSLFVYGMVDKNLGIMESLRMSAAITKGSKGNLFLFGLLTVLVNIAGALVLGVGLLVSIPLTMLATAYVYRKLSAAGDSAPVAPAPVPVTQ